LRIAVCSLKMQTMNVSTYLRRYGPTLDALAKDAGLSHHYVRHLARPVNARSAGRTARVLLARAFRIQAQRLIADADALDAILEGKGHRD